MSRGKLLFISQRINNKASGARVVSTTNLEIAREIFGFENISVYNIVKKRNNKLSNVVHKSIGLLDGLRNADLSSIDQLISNGLFTFVYLDSSYFGLLARMIKLKYPSIIVITFYHDVLVHWWKETGLPKLFSWSFNKAIYKRSESLCVKYSDRNIVMTTRDKNLLHEIYSLGNDKIDIIPLSIDDKSYHGSSRYVKNTSNLLFIGVDYRPNVVGIEWFLENVQPFLKVKLTIVGKGMEKYRAKWESDDVEVVGSVDSLEEWYNGSDAVIIPLFSGSGMKVKTAEALSYGKPVFSTDEGLLGYQVDGIRGIFRCNSAQAFINAINSWLIDNKLEGYIPEIRGLFEEKYSKCAAENSLIKVIDSCQMSQ